MKPGLVTIGRMKKKTISPSGLRPSFAASYSGVLWGFLACGAWAFRQYFHWQKGAPFSGIFFLKGSFLLILAATAYHFSVFRKGYSSLGLFPLLWLAVSKFQWDICAGENRFAAWLSLFLASEILIFTLADGRKLLGLLAPLWFFLGWLFHFSFLIPLAFLTAPSGRFKRSGWVRWGGLAAGAALFLWFRCWSFFYFAWVDLFDLLITGGFGTFLILGWLGLAAFPRKGTFRHGVFPLFGLLAGLLFWAGPGLGQEIELFQWALVFFAGFGLESFRRDLMDPTWHGRLTWAAIGLALFGGVL
jgi:hypothetical protein